VTELLAAVAGPLDLRTDVDAVVVSSRNELTPDSRWPDDS
jgi:hypothetical protein